MDRRLRVLLFQLPVPNNPTLNVPLALGYLKAYAHAQGLLDHAGIEILPRALADHAGDALLVEEIVARRPEVLGISLYTWNSERSLEIARRVKAQLPTLRVVVGGPEVQRDNSWVLEHPAVDVCVIGEGEQTFADLLRFWCGSRLADRSDALVLNADSAVDPLAQIPGLAYRWQDELRFTADRVALSDLAVIPSPYLLGYLETPPDSMLMVEISRWCPYACSFCLYGRNMGIKLGNRYFSLERVLQEIAWGRERGINRVHFIEANLNLVPLFWPLMRALEVLNADHQMTFYAELRGEHLTEEVVAALDRCNVRYVEVGLQTANLVALRASHRRTDLQKWAAGTRRLYAHNIEVYLDVILGLPADDPAGVAETLDFIQRESLGPYDIFTLQVLPGTAVRQQAVQYDLGFQERPPYYVLHTDQFSYADLRRLRRQLKLSVDLPPDAIEGMPLPRPNALIPQPTLSSASAPIERIWLSSTHDDHALLEAGSRLARHVDIVLDQVDLPAVTPLLTGWIAQNPATVFDLYLWCADLLPEPAALIAWRDSLPYQPGYLDRVAVYLEQAPDTGHRRVSPRCWLVLPWTSIVDPDSYAGVAEVIWRFELADGEPVPFGAWYGAGGSGIWLHFTADASWDYRAEVVAQIREWERETGRSVWLAEALLESHAALV
ncbi:MAG: B12-binding domain-containing radical SAM protein [Chloroflexi bacterium]|nr:B12-binding domain-containing radical SAM protein [Chloroflexota bacterium]